MGIMNKMLESFGYMRREDIFKGASTKSSNSKESDHVDGLSDQSVWALIDNIRDISVGIGMLYAEYDVMATDVIISAALDMYADDATQTKSTNSSVIRVESATDDDNKTLIDDLTTFLGKVNVEDLIWSSAYNTAKYGDEYWRVHLTDDRKDIDSVEVIHDPSSVIDLYKNGKRANYGYDNARELEGVINASGAINNNQMDQYSLYSPQSFLHFSIRSSGDTERIKIVDPKVTDADGNAKLMEFTVRRGRSMIEDVRSIYRILRALEDSLLATRLSKSGYTRMFNIEVGDSTPSDTRNIVNRVKNLFDSKASLDVNSGYYETHKASRPHMDPIFNPVRNGKGSITLEEVGGQYDVKSIVDIDYFKNKLFAGIKIPASFLGYEENLQGNDTGDMMAQLDIRYARSLKKLITAIEAGLTDLCDIWLELRGRSNEVGNYKIEILSSSVNEEKLRMAELEAKVNAITSLSSSISSEVEGVNSAEILSILMKEYISDDSISDQLAKVLNDAKSISELSTKLTYQEKLAELAANDDKFLELIRKEVESRTEKESPASLDSNKDDFNLGDINDEGGTGYDQNE